MISFAASAPNMENDIEQARASNMEEDKADTACFLVSMQISSDIEMAKDILKTLNTEVIQNGSESHGSECCIYRVPNQLRNVNSKAYDPNLISIGPLHRENKGLEAMEKEKLNYFRKLTEGDGMDEKKMCDIVISIKNQEERLRNCYSEKSILMESRDDFVKMILLDAVFIIQFFLESKDDTDGPKNFEPGMTFDDIREDLLLLENQLPLFILQEIYDRVYPHGKDKVANLLRKANPFLNLATCHFIKESFLKRVETRPHIVEGSKHFTDLLRNLMLGAAIGQCDFRPTLHEPHIVDWKTHFTDLLRKMMLGRAIEQCWQTETDSSTEFPALSTRSDKVMLGGANEQSEQSDFMWSDKVTLGFEQSEHSCQTGDSASTEFSAKLKTHFTDLLRKLMFCRAIEQSDSSSGVDGKTAALVLSTRVKYSAVMLLKAGVRFDAAYINKCLVNITFDKGVLKIPRLEVDQNFERRIRNIMALEQCCYPSEAYICSYMKLMDHLIDSAEDVGLLVRKGIIVHRLGDDAAVSNMINNLCENIGDNYALFGDISRRLNAHYDNRSNHRKATLKLVYFPNIWRGTATVAAAILLILTFIQAVCSVKSLL